MKKSLLVLSLFILSGGAFLACTETTSSGSGDLVVAVSILPESGFVGEVVGNLAEVITVIPPGYSPETYEPTALFMAELADADVYFTIGVPAEDTSILPSLSGPRIVALEEVSASLYPDRSFSEGGEDRDPHIWLSLRRVAGMVEAVAETMGEIDPAHASVYADNAASYLEELHALDRLLQDVFSNLTQRTFLVYHPAFGYFADDYGLEMMAVEEEGKEATPGHLAEIISLAREKGITTVFYQAEVDSSQVAALAEELAGTMVELDPLAEDYLGNMLVMASAIREALD